ncbi:MAG TPA: A/G-specific adenine glycosylase [Parvularculaceae bacterium]|nr:A/G-specific adenine glycosylase [Parvularculaceae bacterium]
MAARKSSPHAGRGVSAALLRWYDAHARALPWRVPPNVIRRADPYRVWLSEIMLQQTTVATVRPRFEQFLARWPNVEALAAAPLDEVLNEWAGLGYYARARNLHQCARAIVERGGFPETEDGLLALPGVGAYTAAAIAAIAFDKKAVVVDGNIERVMARLFAIQEPLPSAKPVLKEAAALIWPQRRSGDFAQGLMDLGAGVCTPRAPNCAGCPLSRHCRAFASGAPEDFPRRAPKKQKPTRYGASFALFDRNGRVLVERRPEKGLLGGMLGLPGTPWASDKPNGEARDAAPGRATWRHAGLARHSFTHFHLELEVYAGDARQLKLADNQQWADPKTVRLPTVMRKALAVAAKERESAA